MHKAEVEIEYRMNPETTPASYYFNVFVRSTKVPERLKVLSIKRGPEERVNIGIAAGALAEAWGEELGEDRHPDSAANAAMRGYDRLIAANPIPGYGEQIVN